ncbi:MAG: DUF2203 domain-containing protein [Verrucomicrobiota bacterium]
MDWQFTRHYTREEARTLLPKVRQWLEHLQRKRRQVEKIDDQISQLLASGNDIGGSLVNQQVKILAEMKGVLNEFSTREIQIKDLDRGLIDFPAFIGGKEVFLCWEQDEEDIEYWHDLESGYAGREKL